jgi:hypothetical protein
MVDITAKLDKIFDLINQRHYFTINRARQYGKTTVFAEWVAVGGKEVFEIRV